MFERYVAIYCLSEIYRFAALTLQSQKEEARPKHSDFEGFLDCLNAKAYELEKHQTAIPWYLWQQVALFMAINEESVNIPDFEELSQYKTLLRVLKGDRRFALNEAVEKRLPLYIVAYQVSSRKKKIISNMLEWISKIFSKKHKARVAVHVLETLALMQPEMYEKLIQQGRQIDVPWNGEAKKILRKFGIGIKPLKGKLKDYSGSSIPLSRLIKRTDNPFRHENAFLNIALAVINLFDKYEKVEALPPHGLEVTCTDWEKIFYPDVTGNILSIKFITDLPEDHRFDSPDWLAEEEDSKMIYALGSLLRSCATGELDYTTRQYLLREDVTHAYHGVKSSWYKRRIGMSHQPEALAGYSAPMSSWVSELLYNLLQWPGLEIRINESDWWVVDQLGFTLEAIKNVVLDRIRVQAQLYGHSSGMPIYVELIQHPTIEPDHLKIVMAQSLLPKSEHFLKFGIKLDEPNYRGLHSNHVATMARLICSKLTAIKQAEGVSIAKPPLADLIIFPELSIPERDIGTLMRLADKTGAMIFCGLVFRDEGTKIVNSALWLIPFRNGHGRQWIMRHQGKKHMTGPEKYFGIKPSREYQLVIELKDTLKGQSHGFRLTGAICYDATDIRLAADLRDVTNTFIVSALNKDIDTFDAMVDALHYHMYQPVVLVNSGEFGGSAAKAPYKEKYHKQISHTHGNNQISISIFDLNMYDFAEKLILQGSDKEKKTPPAGLKRVS